MRSPDAPRPRRKFWDASRLPSDRVFIVPTLFGFLYGAVALALLLASFVWQNDNLFLFGALLSTFGLVAMQQTHFNLAALSVAECEPAPGFAGETAHWRVLLANRAGAFSVRVFDTHLDAGPAPQSVAVKLGARGQYRLRRLRVASTYPLGLFYAWKFCPVDAHFAVYPEPLPGFLEGRAQPQAAQAAQDFAGHREFRAGDSLRRVDWKALARREQWLVKQFESERADIVWLEWTALGSGSVEARLSQLAGAVQECARQGKLFGLALPGQRIEPGAGPAHAGRCLAALAAFGGVVHEMA